jgi:hypothetical protein
VQHGAIASLTLDHLVSESYPLIDELRELSGLDSGDLIENELWVSVLR